jgi:peptide-methionine (R)-S-oxide reductase
MTSIKTLLPEQRSLSAAASRRRFLLFSLAACAGGNHFGSALAAGLSSPAPGVGLSIEEFSPAGKSLGLRHPAKIVKTDAEWRSQLTADAYEVTRHAGTERPFTGALTKNHADGLYRCICCDTALFDSKTKFESGTGWPSFWQPISATNVVKNLDTTYGMQRDEISCRLCDAHLGHVFDDGPKPTGLRYCMNSVALRFAARA